MASDASPLAIPAEQLWTVHEAAAFLRIGRNAVYGMVKAGELPSVRIGSRVRFIPGELRAWIEQQKNRTVASVVPIAPGR